jgi:hypothetical protein
MRNRKEEKRRGEERYDARVRTGQDGSKQIETAKQESTGRTVNHSEWRAGEILQGHEVHHGSHGPLSP